MKIDVQHNVKRELPQVDITAPEGGVQISVRPDGKVIWVNVDGVCVLRVCEVPYLELDIPENIKVTRL